MITLIQETSLGNLRGFVKDDAIYFNGIPYARTVRFESPVMIEYLGDYDCTGIPSECPQFKTYVKKSEEPDFYEKEFSGNPDVTYNENQMCLSIVTKRTYMKMPVLIFIHGGGFECGSVHELPYGMSSEYLKRDVLLVNISYRLNIFGFYRNHNYGLEDMICAVEWVRKYIDEFGGDPERITLMGQSAGAMSIFDLLLTKHLKGMVQSAIMLSGAGSLPSFARPYTEEESREYWDGMLKEGGLADDEELKKLDDRSLFELWFRYTKKNFNFHLAHPGIDGTIIPDYSKNIIDQGKELDIPVMVGVTSQDYLGPIAYHIAYRYLLKHTENLCQDCYGYFFDRTLPGNSYKAFHSSDLWYMMGQMEKSWRLFEKKDYQLKKMMMDCVAEFIHTGNPGHDWKPISKKNHSFKVFDGKENGTVSPFVAYLKTTYHFLFDRGPM